MSPLRIFFQMISNFLHYNFELAPLRLNWMVVAIHAPAFSFLLSAACLTVCQLAVGGGRSADSSRYVIFLLISSFFRNSSLSAMCLMVTA
ncbi:hypothetical protein FKM82_027983 [Ascaphus truei]